MSSTTVLPVDGEKLFRQTEILCWTVCLVTIPAFGLGVLLYVVFRFWREKLRTNCLETSAEIRDDVLTIRQPGPFGKTDHIPLRSIVYMSVRHAPLLNWLGISNIQLICTSKALFANPLIIPAIPLHKVDETLEMLRSHQNGLAQQTVTRERVSDVDVP
jgi:hypothetical protein